MGPAASTPAGPTLNMTPEEIAWIAEHPTIRVHNETDWPPFNFNEDGEPVGFTVEYMNLVAARAGLQLEYVTGPTFDEFLGLMRSRDLDVMINTKPTPERQTYINFTTTFFATTAGVYTREGDTQIKVMDDLRDKRVAVPAGFFHQGYMERNYPNAELLLEADVVSCLYAVLEGRADAAISTYASMNYLINKRTLPGLQLAFVPKDRRLIGPNAIAVRKDWPVLRDILQKGMDALDEKEVTALRHKWLGLESVQVSGAARLELTTEEQAWVSEHPIIRAHNEMNWPPFNFNENGQPRGFSIDLIDLVAEQTGLNVEYVSGPSWDEFKAMLQAGDLDILLNVDTSPRNPITRYSQQITPRWPQRCSKGSGSGD